MVRIIIAAGALAMLVSPAAAQPEYDASIDRAAAAIVAKKIGEIRSGFAYDQLPDFVVPVEWRRTGPDVAHAPHGALRPA